jgi:hypothetical protein
MFSGRDSATRARIRADRASASEVTALMDAILPPESDLDRKISALIGRVATGDCTPSRRR